MRRIAVITPLSLSAIQCGRASMTEFNVRGTRLNQAVSHREQWQRRELKTMTLWNKMGLGLPHHSHGGGGSSGGSSSGGSSSGGSSSGGSSGGSSGSSSGGSSGSSSGGSSGSSSGSSSGGSSGGSWECSSSVFIRWWMWSSGNNCGGDGEDYYYESSEDADNINRQSEDDVVGFYELNDDDLIIDYDDADATQYLTEPTSGAVGTTDEIVDTNVFPFLVLGLVVGMAAFVAARRKRRSEESSRDEVFIEASFVRSKRSVADDAGAAAASRRRDRTSPRASSYEAPADGPQ